MRRLSSENPFLSYCFISNFQPFKTIFNFVKFQLSSTLMRKCPVRTNKVQDHTITAGTRFDPQPRHTAPPGLRVLPWLLWNCTPASMHLAGSPPVSAVVLPSSTPHACSASASYPWFIRKLFESIWFARKFCPSWYHLPGYCRKLSYFLQSATDTVLFSLQVLGQCSCELQFLPVEASDWPPLHGNLRPCT
jgi:hypothetical protein